MIKLSIDDSEASGYEPPPTFAQRCWADEEFAESGVVRLGVEIHAYPQQPVEILLIVGATHTLTLMTVHAQSMAEALIEAEAIAALLGFERDGDWSFEECHEVDDGFEDCYVVMAAFAPTLP
jgi:hypothetical protein